MDFTRIFREDEILPSLTYLNDLVKAIKKVDNEYCIWKTKQKVLQKLERVFAYELYFQFRTLMIEDPTKYSNTRFDGEINKQLSTSIDTCGTDIIANKLYFSPDLVLHQNQLDYEQENQKLIIEIKSKYVSDKNLAKDIIKLNHYIVTLNFQYAVFISVNTNEHSIKEKIRRKFSIETANRLSDNFKRIIVIVYRNRKLCADRLYDLIIDTSEQRDWIFSDDC